MILLTGFLAACQEEDVKPSDNENTFLPSTDATDATSVLRREFYEATGCFLLFSDTLRHEYIGVNEYGTPLYETELLEMGWTPLGSNSSVDLGYGYITNTEQQREVSDFISQYIYKYMQDAMPFSILAVNKLEEYEYDEYYDETDTTELFCYTNSRCMVLDFGGLWETEEDLNTFAQDYCCEIIFAGFGGDPYWDYEGGAAEAFFQITPYNRYGRDKNNRFIEHTDDWTGSPEEYMKKLYAEGFIEDVNNELFPTQREDGVSFIKACLTMTDEEFRAKFSEYDDIMEKYEIMKPLVDATGIKFE